LFFRAARQALPQFGADDDRQAVLRSFLLDAYSAFDFIGQRRMDSCLWLIIIRQNAMETSAVLDGLNL